MQCNNHTFYFPCVIIALRDEITYKIQFVSKFFLIWDFKILQQALPRKMQIKYNNSNKNENV